MSDDDGARSHEPDEDRRAILARRSRFVAMALAGLTSAACGDGTPGPFACLEPPAIVTPPGPEGAPPVEMQPVEPEAAPPVAPQAPAPQAPDPQAPEPPPAEEPVGMKPPPQPCLRRPAPCLSVAPRICLSDIGFKSGGDADGDA